MASDLNRCEFIGRLGRDVEMKYTQAGVSVANFSIAVGEKYKTKSGEQVENTEWVRCVAWRQLAEICGKYLAKGSQVFVAGKMTTRSWEDNEGVKRYTTEIQVSDLQMLGSKGSQQGEPEPQDDSDSIPF